MPFFAPLYEKANQFHFYSYRLPRATLEEALEGQMAHPYFPVDMNTMHAVRTFTEIQQGPFPLDDFSIQARHVKHPQGCLIFRIDNNGKSVLYATDNEPGEETSDRAIRELARGVDVLIFDSQYSPDQIQGTKRGWGHNTWEEGAHICQEAGIKQFILFHHDPERNDDAVDELEAIARARFANCRAAYEGLEITL